MAGIPIYTTSPINATKATAVTPQTAAPPTQPTFTAPALNAATTTAAASTTSSYLEAKPGAAGMPAPTAAASRYVPVQPTPTLKADAGPAPPQPGAFPVPNATSTR